MKLKIYFSLLALLLSACSAGVEDLAASGNWSDIGYRDGIKGQHSRSFSELQKLGEANQAEYDQGYVRGVTEYCNPEHAYQIGLSGSYYQGVCEGTVSAQKFRMEWLRGWNEGK
ncbi:hypothetical protein MACH09_22930 [Vibrio sp. MACH09]|uniref:DUF2799 domain-containing protein n=1 Tax=unclassified Vibrio TaxID=2614977 RepID=UPI001493C6FB|nr:MULTISPECIES: DUF2799 domain-containing protein [unclassified Vibrio]NOI64789.1 DUF2799 domain-containing protein [Vibrio sp. 99-8-1]GLO61785.1 hypothetical protein MACH09_22930 [Vibrio sp. MACH09]